MAILTSTVRLVALLVVGLACGCTDKAQRNDAPFIFVGEEKVIVSPSGQFDLYWSKTGSYKQFVVFSINSRKQAETGVANFFPDYGFPSGETFVLAWDRNNRAWLLQGRTVRRWSLKEKAWELAEFADGANDAERNAFLEWVKTRTESHKSTKAR